MPCGANVVMFIRSIIGVNRKEAVECFSTFISGSELNAEQEDAAGRVQQTEDEQYPCLLACHSELLSAEEQESAEHQYCKSVSEE